MDKSEEQKLLFQESKVEEHAAFRGNIITSGFRNYHHPDWNTPHNYDFVSHPGAAAIIAVDDEKKIQLVHQYRPAIKQVLIELPAGKIDNMEAPEVCAQRELREEIGCRAESLEYLIPIHPSPGFCDEVVHLFLATTLIPDPLPAPDYERIDVQGYSLCELHSLIRAGSITDAKTITGIFYYETFFS